MIGVFIKKEYVEGPDPETAFPLLGHVSSSACSHFNTRNSTSILCTDPFPFSVFGRIRVTV